MRLKHSEYMHWAKIPKSGCNLATSGVGPFPLRELGAAIDQIEINGDNAYGYAPLIQAIAAKCGVDPACVVTAQGTSFANHLAIAALIEPGDEVLIEHPTYELIVSAAAYIGANVRRFARTPESGYALDPAEVRRAITPRTRLIIVTNLHNPSGVLASGGALREIGGLARGAGARVLVDEVYLDAVYENTPPTSFLLGPEFVVTNSLTKVYGLSGLRCGWILAQPDLARAMWRLNDLFAATPAHPAECLSVVAFAHLDAVRARARRVVEADRATLAAFRDRAGALISGPRTNWGTTAFLATPDAEAFVDRLREEHQTWVVPGRFFEMPGCFRIGMGVDSARFNDGLSRIERALMR